MKPFDTTNWNRKEHFEFFSNMKNPYFGVVSEVDCTRIYNRCKSTNTSFFASYLHKSMIAVNSILEFKLRILEGKVYVIETVNAGATITRDDGTFAFIYVPFSFDFNTFDKYLQEEITAVRNSTGLRLNEDNVKVDLIRHSTLPWIHFTAILHPTNHNNSDSVPKITFGRFREQDHRKYLPVSVEANHGLVDGFHFSRYFKIFQDLLFEDTF